jgi:predicted MFS family arabinose efflux permease
MAPAPFMAKPENEPVQARIDYRGAVLVAVGIGSSIFGLQQSALWGWNNGGTWACIIGGLLVIAIFVRIEMGTRAPLINVQIFRIRAFAVENLVLFIAMSVFIPVFFFASEFAQISLRKTASEAGLFLLSFFIGFAIAAQIGGRILDREGAKRAGVMGCAIAAVGFGFWASKVTHLHFSSQLPWIIVAGAGMGMMLARPTPTRSTAPRASSTARPPASPRPCGTTGPASGWQCWAPFS